MMVLSNSAISRFDSFLLNKGTGIPSFPSFASCRLLHVSSDLDPMGLGRIVGTLHLTSALLRHESPPPNILLLTHQSMAETTTAGLTRILNRKMGIPSRTIDQHLTIVSYGDYLISSSQHPSSSSNSSISQLTSFLMKTITDQQQTRSSSNTWILLDNISFIIDYFSSSVIQDYHLHHHYESTSHFSRDILALVFALESFASNLVVYSHSDACLMQSSSSSSSSSTTSSTSSPQQLLHSFITKYLSSRADLDIAIRPLSTGISQNVHGEVVLSSGAHQSYSVVHPISSSNSSSSSSSSPFPVLLQFKVEEGGVSFFAKGLSTDVL